MYGEKTTTTMPERCIKGVTLTIQVVDKATGDPMERATVTITSKKTSPFDNLPELQATHKTNSEGKVTQLGVLNAIYNIVASKVVSDGVFNKRVDIDIKMLSVLILPSVPYVPSLSMCLW